MSTSGKTYYVGHVAPALMQHPRLSIGAKALAVLLLAHRNEVSGLCYPTEELMAAELGVAERSVRTYVRELRDNGLVVTSPRQAPRGQAKGRGHSYDLTGLLDLCAVPMLKAADVDRQKTTPRDRQKTTGRDRQKTTPHQSDFRGNEQNNTNRVELDSSRVCNKAGSEPEALGSLTPCNGNVRQTAANEARERQKTTPHSARIEGEPGANPHSTVQRMAESAAVFTRREVNEHLLTPEGWRASDYGGHGDVDDGLEAELYATIAVAGGEPVNHTTLSELVKERGVQYCEFQRSWLLRRIAAAYERREPVVKPAGLYIAAVREKSDVNPSWPEFDDNSHRWAADARESMRRQKNIGAKANEPREYTEAELIPF